MPIYRVTVEGKVYNVEVPDPHARPVRAIVDGETIEVQVEAGTAAPGVPSPNAPSPRLGDVPGAPSPRPGPPPGASSPRPGGVPSGAPSPRLGGVPSGAPSPRLGGVPSGAPSPRLGDVPALTPSTAGAPGEVTAPLPGVVISVAVSEGDAVEPGQELCVLEAMKMNNPIRATQSGTVAEVFVSVGQQVPHGTPLLRLE